jgi:hypothetical protein
MSVSDAGTASVGRRISPRFKLLAILAYGGVAISVLAVILLILGFGRVGQCSTVDNTYEACDFRTSLLASLAGYPLLLATISSVVALCLRRRPGEKGKWVAASSFLVAPVLLGLLLWGLLHLGIR